MYRIEVAPGEETVFRTIEELAVGIRNGVVTPRARIYHHASQKWLPIGLHPHYKKALEMPAASAGQAPVTSATPIPNLSRLKTHPPAHSQPHSMAQPPEPKPAPERKSAPEATHAPERKQAPPELRHTPEPRTAYEPKPVPKAAVTPRILAPVQSPVIAMQNEILRDLPVISIPEPLPWTVQPPPVTAPPVKTHAPAMHTPVGDARAVHTRAVPAPAADARVTHARVTHAPVTHARMTHAPVAYAPLEYSMPVAKSRDVNAEELLLPRPTARRARRMGGRPFVLLGAAAALVIGTHLVLTATPSASADPSEAPASATGDEERGSPSEVRLPEGGQPSGRISAEAGTNEAPRLTIAPARVPMTPGPAFAGSVPTRPGADSAGPPKLPTPQPGPASTPAPSIAPAPVALDLALPDLPPDSVVPTARTGDTLGMKRILRALNGTKPAELPAAP